MRAVLVVQAALGSIAVAGSECSCPMSVDPVTRACGSAGLRAGRSLRVDAKSALPPGYTVALSFDHAALVARGASQPSGDDVRIVTLSGEEPRQLARRAEAERGWNRSDTTVEFRLEYSLGAGATASDHVLCYGAAAPGAPPADPDDIYFYHSGFDDPVELDGWRAFDVEDQGLWSVTDGALRQSQTDNRDVLTPLPLINHKLLLAETPPTLGLRVQLRIRTSDDDLVGLGLCTADSDPDGFYVGWNYGDNWFDSNQPRGMGYWAAGDSVIEPRVSTPVGAWMQVEARWKRDELTLRLGDGAAKSWPVGPQQPGAMCIVMNSMPGTDIDDLTLRLVVDEPPTVSLGEEQLL